MASEGLKDILNIADEKKLKLIATTALEKCSKTELIKFILRNSPQKEDIVRALTISELNQYLKTKNKEFSGKGKPDLEKFVLKVLEESDAAIDNASTFDASEEPEYKLQARQLNKKLLSHADEEHRLADEAQGLANEAQARAVEAQSLADKRRTRAVELQELANEFLAMANSEMYTTQQATGGS